MANQNGKSTPARENVTLPTHRKFSDSSLDNFATQFLKETDPDNSPKFNPEISKTSDSLNKQQSLVSIDESPESESSKCSSPVPGSSKVTGIVSGNIGKTLQEICSDEESSASGIGESHLGNQMPSMNETLSVSSDESVSPVLAKRDGESNNAEANQNGGELAVVVVEPVGEFQLERSQYNKPSGFLECQLEAMYYLGVSSYRREEYMPPRECVKIIQIVVYWLFCIFSCIQFICFVKNDAIQVIAEKHLKYCIQFGYSVVRLSERCMFIYMISFLSMKISVMLLHVRSMVQFQNTLQKRFLKRVICMTILSVLVTFYTFVVCYCPLNDWDIVDGIQSRALVFSKTLFAWNTSSAKAYNDVIDTLVQEYYVNDITMLHVFMGLMEGLFDICAVLQGEMIRDLLLTAAIVLYSGWRYFEKRIEPMILIHPNNADAAEVEACLRHYRALRLATSSINESLRSVFNFFVLENIFLFGYITVQMFLSKGLTAMRTFYSVMEAIKASLIFCIALRVHRKNGNVCTWLRMMSAYNGPVNVKAILGMSVQAALDDIRDNPIGFGMEYFLINETFLMGFLTVVASMISLLLEFNKP